MHPNSAYGIATSVDPDQTAQGLHGLRRPVCPKTYDHYGKYYKSFVKVSGWQAPVYSRKIMANPWKNSILLEETNQKKFAKDKQ